MAILRVLGWVWALPVTVTGILYVAIPWLFGWYSFYGRCGFALVWKCNVEKQPEFLKRAWKRWAGHAVGCVIVLKLDPSVRPTTLVHEQKHVDQCMRLGVFQPILWSLLWFVIKVGCPGSDPYYDNPFEIDARRSAGQVIDVIGAIRKLNEAAAAKSGHVS